MLHAAWLGVALSVISAISAGPNNFSFFDLVTL